MSTRKTPPYWLSGTETCSLCTFNYVLEMELRCVACDRGFCEHCVIVVRETREIFCPECHPDETRRS